MPERELAGSASAPALELVDLDVAYKVKGRDKQVLRGLSLTIEPGQAYGLVGESGCGKSTAALAIARYLPRNGRVRSGSISVAGQDALAVRGRELRRYRADAVSMVYQNPGTALNPGMRIGRQVAEVYTTRGVPRGDAYERSRAMLQKVQIADPDSVMERFSHQLSGGMQQRVVIAMALADDPSLLILDEPTTGLDATVEAEVLDLIEALQSELHTSVLFISHNLGVISKMCDQLGVLYAGRLVEEGPTQQVLADPRHPYTVGLLRCVPRPGARKDHGRLDTIPGFLPPIGADLPGCVFTERCAMAEDICHQTEPLMIPVSEGHGSRCHFHERAQELPRTMAQDVGDASSIDRSATPILQLDDLVKTFRQGTQEVHALAGVSAAIWPGETLGLVGESGSGKTTLARTVLGLVEPTTGTVELDGGALAGRSSARSREQIAALQIIFQNPDAALNRRHTTRRMLRRTLKVLANVTGKTADERVASLADAVRLPPRAVTARPSQLSGGQKQRVAIARAFAGEPRIVICDEPTSALDVSVQAAILNLLVELQVERKTAYLFISHDLGVVRYLSDRIAVLYLGRLMELGPAEVVFSGPHHPYTEALLSSVPQIGAEQKDRVRLEGEIPSAADPPSGCVFHTRCPRRIGTICDEQEAPLVEVEPGHMMSCHIPIEELRRLQRVGGAGEEQATPEGSPDG
jgi:peptide/nickel transport system ATP-binding protein